MRGEERKIMKGDGRKRAKQRRNKGKETRKCTVRSEKERKGKE